MQRWWHLAIRNWWVDRGPALATLVAVGLGVAVVVMMTTFYESAVRAVREEILTRWLGRAHLTVAPPGAHWGQLEASLADDLAKLDGVAVTTAKLIRRSIARRLPEEPLPPGSRPRTVDLIGVDAATIATFLSLPNLRGRMIEPGQRGVAVIERPLADELGVDLGGSVFVAPYDPAAATELKIVGIFDSQRIAEFQQPMVIAALLDAQQIHWRPGLATLIDLQLTDSSRDSLRAGEQRVREYLRARGLPYEVSSAATRLGQLEEAERITRLLVTLVAAVTLMSGFFIMLTTLSASFYKQARTLGVMRCIGFTRGQLARLVMVYSTPPTVAGALLGVPLGWLFVQVAQWLGQSRRFSTEGQAIEPIRLAVEGLSSWGLSVAFLCVAAVWLLAMGILMIQVCSVTPLRAAAPEARAARRAPVIGALALGVALIAVHEWMIGGGMNPAYWLRPVTLFTGLVTLGGGFILIAPAVVWTLGSACASVTGRILGLRPALARDQFGRSPWLAGGVCWVLMAGLSLIVYVAVRAEGVFVFWDFPSRLPEAFVWTQDYITSADAQRAAALPGVGEVSLTTDVDCEIDVVRSSGPGANALLTFLFSKLTRPVFVAGDVDTFLQLAKLGFSESDTDEVRDKLMRGGYVLVPPQTARSKGLRKGDRVRITIDRRSAEFEVADIVESPALDLAVNFFGAESYMQFAASSAVLGTREDLQRCFGVDSVAMIMCNLDLKAVNTPKVFTEAAPPPRGDMREAARRALQFGVDLPEERDAIRAVEERLRSWLEGPADAAPPDEAVPLLERFVRAASYAGARWADASPEDRWMMFRERLVLFKIAYEIGRRDAIVGSTVRLRQALHRDIRRGMALVTWAPSFALLVASLGIANLMLVRVTMRARAIATLRAIGMTRGQTIRLILAEAVALGLLGSIMGVGLGFYLARSANEAVYQVTAIRVPWVIPWPTLALAVLVTVSVCILAGIRPARVAARDNVLAALQVE